MSGKWRTGRIRPYFLGDWRDVRFYMDLDIQEMGKPPFFSSFLTRRMCCRGPAFSLFVRYWFRDSMSTRPVRFCHRGMCVMRKISGYHGCMQSWISSNENSWGKRFICGNGVYWRTAQWRVREGRTTRWQRQQVGTMGLISAKLPSSLTKATNCMALDLVEDKSRENGDEHYPLHSIVTGPAR